MKIRSKTIITVLATTGFIVVILFFAARTIFLERFRILEENKTREKVISVRAGLFDEIERLDSLVSEWAFWDETYRFLLGRDDQVYIEKNLHGETFENLQINVAVFLDARGNVFFQKAYDLDQHIQVPLPEGMEEFLKTDARLFADCFNGKNVYGIVSLSNGLMLVAAQPVLNSYQTSPPNGVLIMGRILDERIVKKISRVSGERFDIIPLDSSLKPDVLEAAGYFERGGEEIFVSTDQNTSVTGYALINDIHEKPALIIRLSSGRSIYSLGRDGMIYFLGALLLASFISSLVLFIVLETYVVSKLTIANDRIVEIRKSGNLSLRLVERGSDEMASLGREINLLLSSLEESQRILLEKEERLIFDAGHDALTNLPNRKNLMQQITKMIAALKQKEYGTQSAALFVDLDNFKNINDQYDHTVGDKLLVAVSQRINKQLRNDDFFARFAGDEFVILLNGVAGISEAIKIAERIRSSVSTPYNLDKVKFTITLSIGVAMISIDSQPDDILKFADIAMYRAKGKGKDQIEIFDESILSPGGKKVKNSTDESKDQQGE